MGIVSQISLTHPHKHPTGPAKEIGIVCYHANVSQISLTLSLGHWCCNTTDGTRTPAIAPTLSHQRPAALITKSATVRFSSPRKKPTKIQGQKKTAVQWLENTPTFGCPGDDLPLVIWQQLEASKNGFIITNVVARWLLFISDPTQLQQFASCSYPFFLGVFQPTQKKNATEASEFKIMPTSNPFAYNLCLLLNNAPQTCPRRYKWTSSDS